MEQWGLFERALLGPTEGNPFLDVRLTAAFSQEDVTFEIDGFYDGDGVYRLRFMPPFAGKWRFRTCSNIDQLNAQEGTFECGPATGSNHGPVRVIDKSHFAYADGSPFRPFGTTSYAWVHQGSEQELRTLDTLAEAPFNKLRMCVFPKHYKWNENEPVQYPYPLLGQGSSEFVPDREFDMHPQPSSWSFDFERFNPAFFQHLELRIAELGERGIEADLILFHPYDRWGFADMTLEKDERYLRYVVARFAAFRNIWWSMANEYDLVASKSVERWDYLLKILRECDPFDHLRSIHNWMKFYDHTKSAITHVSAQHDEVPRLSIWREQYQKPIIVDECGYEGDIADAWGNLSAKLVHRFWIAIVCGGYATHGETFLGDQMWWSHGGVLKGESIRRIAFLRRLLEEAPAPLEPVANMTYGIMVAGLREMLTLQDLMTQNLAAREEELQDEERRVISVFPGVYRAHEYYLFYAGVRQPREVAASVPGGEQYRADIIDTWEMTVTPVPDPVVRESVVCMPGQPFQALRLERIE